MTYAQPLSPADAAWLHMDRPANLMVINSVMWFDQPADWEAVRRVLDERVVQRFPRFRMKVVERHRAFTSVAFVEDPDFDLARHLRHGTLPAPGDAHALQQFVSERMSVPLDRDRPLWEAYFVDGYAGGSALVTRMHHCIADGIALARVMFSLTDERPDAGITPTDGLVALDHHDGWLASLTRPVTTLAGALVHQGVESLRHPTRVKDEASALATLLAMPPDHRTALTGQPVPTKAAVWSDPIPLADVKAAGAATGSTVNDVLMAALAGALRRYLEERGGPVRDIRAIVPFNLRPLDQPLPASLGNEFGLVFLSMPVGVPDRATRLAETRRRMRQIKDSALGPVSYAILSLTGLAPQRVGDLVVSVFGAKGSAVVTNVPGPTRPIYLAGTRVAGCVSWVPSSGRVPLGVSIFSYAGKVVVGVAADTHLVPEPERILAAFREEVEALLPPPRALVGAGKSVGHGMRRR